MAERHRYPTERAPLSEDYVRGWRDRDLGIPELERRAAAAARRDADAEIAKLKDDAGWHLEAHELAIDMSAVGAEEATKTVSGLQVELQRMKKLVEEMKADLARHAGCVSLTELSWVCRRATAASTRADALQVELNEARLQLEEAQGALVIAESRPTRFADAFEAMTALLGTGEVEVRIRSLLATEAELTRVREDNRQLSASVPALGGLGIAEWQTLAEQRQEELEASRAEVKRLSAPLRGLEGEVATYEEACASARAWLEVGNAERARADALQRELDCVKGVAPSEGTAEPGDVWQEGVAVVRLEGPLNRSLIQQSLCGDEADGETSDPFLGACADAPVPAPPVYANSFTLEQWRSNPKGVLEASESEPVVVLGPDGGTVLRLSQGLPVVEDAEETERLPSLDDLAEEMSGQVIVGVDGYRAWLERAAAPARTLAKTWERRAWDRAMLRRDAERDRSLMQAERDKAVAERQVALEARATLHVMVTAYGLGYQAGKDRESEEENPYNDVGVADGLHFHWLRGWKEGHALGTLEHERDVLVAQLGDLHVSGSNQVARARRALGILGTRRDLMIEVARDLWDATDAFEEQLTRIASHRPSDAYCSMMERQRQEALDQLGKLETDRIQAATERAQFAEGLLEEAQAKLARYQLVRAPAEEAAARVDTLDGLINGVKRAMFDGHWLPADQQHFLVYLERAAALGRAQREAELLAIMTTNPC